MKLKINPETLRQALACFVIQEPSALDPENINLCAAEYPELKRLLDSGLNPNTPNWEGTLPLHFFCSMRDPNSVALLLMHGADPDWFDKSGRSAVHHAIRAYDTNILRMLQQAGADMACRDSQGWTIVEHAQDMGYPKWVAIAKQFITEIPAHA
ncbi:MAG: ankyrin repeat domain-containing protein [Gammaproteobacteria bacterium]